LSKTNWLKIQDNFIGVNELVKYNGQLIVFEHAINKWFNVTSAPFIYADAVPFVSQLGGQQLLSATQLFVEIKVPIAVYNSLGANNTARDEAIRAFARRYTLGGWGIVIGTF